MLSGLNSKAKKIFTWLFRIVLIFFATIFLLLIGLKLPPGENLIRSVAQSQLTKILGEEVRIGSIETNIFSHAELRNLSITKKYHQKTIPFVVLRSADVRYNLFGLLKGSFSASLVKVDSLQIHLSQDSSGIVNLPEISSAPKTTKKESSAGLRFHLGRLELKESSVQYVNKTIPLSGSLTNLQILAQSKNQSDDYEFQVNSDSGGVVYQTTAISVTHLDLRGAWEGNQLHADTLALLLPGMTLGGRLSIDFRTATSPIQGDVRLKGRVDALAAKFHTVIPAGLQPLEGSVDMAVRITGTLSKPRFESVVNFPRIQMHDLLVEKGMIRANFTPEALSLSQLRMNLMGGQITGSGMLEFGQQLDHRFDLTIRNVGLGWVWQALYHASSPYKGDINGEVSSSGPLADWEHLDVKARLALREVESHNQSVAGFTTNVSFQNGRAKVDFQQAGSELQVRAVVTKQQLEGNFSGNFENLEAPAQLFNLVGLKGTLQLQGTIGGTINNPHVTTTFSGKKIVYYGIPADNLEGGIRYADSTLFITKTRISGAASQIDTLHLPHTLSGLQGSYSYQAQIEGRMDSLQANLAANLSDLSYSEFHIKKGNIAARLADNRAEISKLYLQADSLGISLAGNYSLLKSEGEAGLAFGEPGSGFFEPLSIDSSSFLSAKTNHFPPFGFLEARFNLSDSSNRVVRATGEKIDLERLATLYPKIKEVGGLLRFGLDFHGTPNEPYGKFAFAINSANFSQVMLDSVKADIDVNPSLVSLDSLRFYVANQLSWVAAQIDLEHTGQGKLSVTGENLTRGKAEGKEIHLKLLQPFLSPGMKLAGVSNYQLRWSGPLKKPHLEGNLELLRGEIQFGPNSPTIDSLRVAAQFEDSLLQIQNISGELRKTPFQLHGRVSYQNWTQFHTRMEMSVANEKVIQASGTASRESMNMDLIIQDLNLSLFRELTPELRKLDGKINSHLTLKGSVSAPDIQGNLQVAQLSFWPTVLDSPLTDGSLGIRFSGNKVQVDTLRLRYKKGTILSSGKLTYASGNFTDLDFAASMKNLDINQPDIFSAVIDSASIDYNKQGGYYNLDGAVHLGNTKIVYNIEPNLIINLLQKAQTPVQQPPAIMQQTRLGIRVIQDKDLSVDNNLARLQIGEDLRLTGNLASPNVSGRVTIEKGYVLYLDRKFDVQSGTFDFVNPTQINPIINLSAQTTVKNYQAMEATSYAITFTLTGPADTARINLSSDPPLSQTDILSLLTLGATTEQLTGTNASGQGASVSSILQNRIESLSTYKLSGYVGHKVGNLLGLQQLTIEGNLFNTSQAPVLVASKTISDRVTITYRTGFGQVNDRSVQLNYQISKHFAVEGETDQTGNTNFDFTYRIKFK